VQHVTLRPSTSAAASPGTLTKAVLQEKETCKKTANERKKNDTYRKKAALRKIREILKCERATENETLSKGEVWIC
jgi:hypothetical protein